MLLWWSAQEIWEMSCGPCQARTTERAVGALPTSSSAPSDGIIAADAVARGLDWSKRRRSSQSRQKTLLEWPELDDVAGRGRCWLSFVSNKCLE